MADSTVVARDLPSSSEDLKAAVQLLSTKHGLTPPYLMDAVMATLGWGGTGKGANLSYFKASMSVNSLTESATKAS